MARKSSKNKSAKKRRTRVQKPAFINVPLSTFYKSNVANDSLRLFDTSKKLQHTLSVKRSRGKTRKMRGGQLDYSLGNQLTNGISNFADSMGSLSMSKIIFGTYTGDNAVYNQPINNMFGAHNKPLV